MLNQPLNKKIEINREIWGQLYQRFTMSFYMDKFQKSKKDNENLTIFLRF